MQTKPTLMLLSRSALFLLIQGLFALFFMISGNPSAWSESTRWWTFIVTIANVGSLFLLMRLYKAEGKKFFDTLRFSRATWKVDLLWLLGFTLVGLPLAAAPREPLGIALFGDAMIPTNMLFQPLPSWAFILSFLFPATIWFAELPTYFGYCMPRLFSKNGQPQSTVLGWLIASLFLAAQHMALPFIPDGNYLLWRFGMFLPFALITGLALKFRPHMMPYFVIGHALMDITTVLVYIMI